MDLNKAEEIQNIYDNPTFFESYKKLRKNDFGFNNLVEQPCIRSLLPALTGKVVLDIGCGFGDFCRYAATQGAAKIIGIDPSVNMVTDAIKNTADKNIEYECIPVEKYFTGRNQFDVIVSSVALHYVKDLPTIVNKAYSWLKSGGEFVFSVEHPICTANPHIRSGEDEEGVFHPIYNYRDEKEFKQTWFVNDVIKYHRTVSTYFNTLLNAEFSIQKIVEPMPDDKLIESKPEFAVHRIRPPLLVILCSKK